MGLEEGQAGYDAGLSWHTQANVLLEGTLSFAHRGRQACAYHLDPSLSPHANTFWIWI